jgi:hypothetical protein
VTTPKFPTSLNCDHDVSRFCNVVQTPLEKIETLKHESFRGSTLYKQQVRILRSSSQDRAKIDYINIAIAALYTYFSYFILFSKMDATSRSKATQRKGVAAGERKAHKAGLAEEVQPLGVECCGRCFEK